MEAVILTGAKQYLVKKGDILDIEKIDADPEKEIVIDKVLLLYDGKKIEAGSPYIKGAQVKALVVGELKDEKKISFKYTRREEYKRKKGHRQKLTRIKITDIKKK